MRPTMTHTFDQRGTLRDEAAHRRRGVHRARPLLRARPRGVRARRRGPQRRTVRRDPRRTPRQGAPGRGELPLERHHHHRRLTAVHELVEEVDRSPDGPSVGAFFDFDGTLIYGFSVLALQAARLRRRDVAPQEFANALVTGIGLVLGQSDYDAVVSSLGRAWRGRSIDEIDEIGRKLFKQKLAGRVYPEARELVAAHHRKGHTVVLASSALSFQVEAMAADLDIEHVLCTRFEVVDGKLTGQLAGPHLWGAGKRRAVEQLAKDLDVDLGASFAYAD